MPNIHAGHRERLKNKFLRLGAEGLEEHELLELLLFYCIPRADTNPLAHRLLDHFGSLTAVLDATPEELEKVQEEINYYNLDQIAHGNSDFKEIINKRDRIRHKIEEIKNLLENN